MSDDPLDALLALDADHYPDPVDPFEDLLAARIGLSRHPGLRQPAWRRIRVAFIDDAGDRAYKPGSEFAASILS